MEFLKKNWAKILVAVIALTGAVLMLVPTFIADNITFIGASQTIGIIIFFAGVVAFLILKMIGKTKDYAKYVGLGISILVLTFMSIGLAGFNKDNDKAEGAFGKAYAYFASVESTVAEGEVLLEGARQTVTSLTTTKGGIQLGLTGNGPLAALEVMGDVPLATVAAGVTSLQPLVALGLGEVTMANIPAALDGVIAMINGQIAENEIALAEGKEQINDANAGSLTILFGYIVTMLAFGLIPTVFAVKKLVDKKDK
jgi:hypothetical protein